MTLIAQKYSKSLKEYIDKKILLEILCSDPTPDQDTRVRIKELEQNTRDIWKAIEDMTLIMRM